MIKKLLIGFVFVSLLFSSCERPEPKPVITIESGKIGVIGYGPVTSRQSIEDLLGRPYKDSLYFVHLENYQRTWNFVGKNNDSNLSEELGKYDSFYIKNNDTISFQKIRFLNIVPNDSTDLNCILYFITLDELNKIDDMEAGYARIDVTNKIKEYDFKKGRVVAYKALPDYEYDPETDKDSAIIEKSYWDLVLRAYDKVGDDYRKEFDNSTEKIDSNLVVPVIRVKMGD